MQTNLPIIITYPGLIYSLFGVIPHGSVPEVGSPLSLYSDLDPSLIPSRGLFAAVFITYLYCLSLHPLMIII